MSKRTKKRLRKIINKIPYLAIILIFIVSIFIFYKPTPAKSSTINEYQVVFVREGETLWQIAKENSGDGDLRELIHQIKKLNNLERSIIYPGQKLIVPRGE